MSHRGKRLQAQYRWGTVIDCLGPLVLGFFQSVSYTHTPAGHTLFFTCALDANPGWSATTVVDTDAVAIEAPRWAMLPVKRYTRAR